ncbi:hypothetical protein LEMLEM_LOCUS8411, partial [Lemmus lemmus]
MTGKPTETLDTSSWELTDSRLTAREPVWNQTRPSAGICFPSHVQHFLLEKIFEVLCVSFPLCPDSFQAEYKFK